MPKRPDGGPAFPRYGNDERTHASASSQDGMTLRDWYAGQALKGILAAHAGPDCNMPTPPRTAIIAFEYADAMLEAGKE